MYTARLNPYRCRYIPLYERCLSQSIRRIKRKPLVRAIISGKQRSVVMRYLEQDVHYLENYHQAMTVLAARVDKSAYKEPDRIRHAFQRFANSAAKERQNNIRHYLKDEKLISPPCLNVQAYSGHILKHAHHSSLRVAAASMLPCFRIYRELGFYISETLSLESKTSKQFLSHPYQHWIENICEATSGYDLMREVLELLAVDACDKQIDTMIQASKISFYLEDKFFDVEVDRNRFFSNIATSNAAPKAEIITQDEQTDKEIIIPQSSSEIEILNPFDYLSPDFKA